MEEYVPKNIPAVSINAKYFVDSGPKKKRDNKTIMTVREVKTDLIYDWFKLFPTVSLKISLLAFLKFSLILSKITIVSDTDNPKIVSAATTKRVSTSAP